MCRRRGASGLLALTNVFRLEAHSDQACSQIFESRNMNDEAKDQRHVNRAGIVENAIQDAMGEDLEGLGATNRLFTVLLYPLQVMRRKRIGAQRLRQNVCCRHRVLKGNVDSDASDRGHRVCGVPDA